MNEFSPRPTSLRASPKRQDSGRVSPIIMAATENIDVVPPGPKSPKVPVVPPSPRPRKNSKISRREEYDTIVLASPRVQAIKGSQRDHDEIVLASPRSPIHPKSPRDDTPLVINGKEIPRSPPLVPSPKKLDAVISELYRSSPSHSAHRDPEYPARPEIPSQVRSPKYSVKTEEDDLLIVADAATERVRYFDDMKNNVPKDAPSLPDAGEEARLKEELRPRYERLFKVTGSGLPEYQESFTHDYMMKQFMKANKEIKIQQYATYWRGVILIYAALAEWLISHILGIKSFSGFFIEQGNIMGDYNLLIYEIAESWTGEGTSPFRPEIRLLLMMLFTTAVFAVSKIATAKILEMKGINFDVYPILRGLQSKLLNTGTSGAPAASPGGFDIAGIANMLGGFFGNKGTPATSAAQPTGTPTPPKPRKAPVFDD